MQRVFRISARFALDSGPADSEGAYCATRTTTHQPITVFLAGRDDDRRSMEIAEREI